MQALGHRVRGGNLSTALEALEADIMRGAIDVLRNSRGLFSHSLIHDALLLHASVPKEEAIMAICTAAVARGVVGLKVAVKDLATRAAHVEAEESRGGLQGWDPGGALTVRKRIVAQRPAVEGSRDARRATERQRTLMDMWGMGADDRVQGPSPG